MDARILVTFAVVLVGCAAAPQLSSIKPGEDVYIFSLRDAAPAAIDFNNRMLGQGAAAGAGGGAVAGALAGLSCGPLAFFCVPAGALLGSGVGAFGGVVVGSSQMLPDEAKARLLAATSAASLRESEAALVAAVESLAKARWRIVPAGPAAVGVSVRIDAIALNSWRNDRIALSVNATVALRRPGAEPQSKSFAYRGPDSDVHQWLEDHDDFVAESFRDAYRHIAHEVVSELDRTSAVRAATSQP